MAAYVEDVLERSVIRGLDHSAGCYDMIFRWNKIGALRCGGAVLSGLMLAASFPGWSQSTLNSFGSVVIFSSIIISSPVAVLSWLVEWFAGFVIVVLANDKHGGCVGV